MEIDLNDVRSFSVGQEYAVLGEDDVYIKMTNCYMNRWQGVVSTAANTLGSLRQTETGLVEACPIRPVLFDNLDIDWQEFGSAHEAIIYLKLARGR